MDDNLISKIVENLELKTVQFNIKNNSANEQDFNLFDTTNLVPINEVLTYSEPNQTVQFVNELPTNAWSSSYVENVNKIFVGNGIGGLYIQDLNTNKIVKKYESVLFFSMFYNTNNEILYACGKDWSIPPYTIQYDFVFLINATTNEIIAKYPVPNLEYFYICFCPNANCFYTTNTIGQILRFDCNTNQYSYTNIPFQMGSSCSVYNSVNGKIYIDYLNYTDYSFGLLIIDPITNQLENTIDLSAYVTNIYIMCFGGQNNTILYGGGGNQLINVFDCYTNTIINTFDVDVSEPLKLFYSLLYNETNNQFYLTYTNSYAPAYFTGNYVAVIDAVNYSVLTTLNCNNTGNNQQVHTTMLINNNFVICWDNYSGFNVVWDGINCYSDTTYIYTQSSGSIFNSSVISLKQQLIYVVVDGVYQNTIEIYDLNYNLITTLVSTYSDVSNSIYNPILDQVFVYAIDGGDIIDCSTNTIIQSISFINYVQGGIYCLENGNYYFCSGDFYFIELNSVTYAQTQINTPYPTSVGGNRRISISENQHRIYQNDDSNYNLWYYNYLDNTSNLIINGITIDFEFGNLIFNPINNYLYVDAKNMTTQYRYLLVIDTENNEVVNQVNLFDTTFGNFSQSNIQLDYINNALVFCFNKAITVFYIVTFNCNTNSLTYVEGDSYNCLNYNPLNNSFYGSSFSYYNPQYISQLYLIDSISVSGGSVDYNFFVQTLNNDPKIICDILIKMPQRYLVNPLNVIYKDANGQSMTTPYLPNTDIDVYQKSPNRGSVKFANGLVINMNTQIDIIIPPLTTVILLIDYKEFLKSDMLDLIVYDDSGKAKYCISQSLEDGEITAKKYWGSKTMPKKINLNKQWLNDMESRFSKVDLIEYNTPKLAGGTSEMRKVYQDLFGFKKEVKSRIFSITEKTELKKTTDIKLSTKKQSIKPKIKN